jgi:hypothetical protein
MTRKGTPDLMSQVLSGKSATAPGEIPTVNDGKAVRVNFFIPEGWKKTLTAHFKAQGLDLSSGIRQALSRYMTEERLR